MPADHIEASTLQAVGRHCHIGQLLPEQPFANHSLFTGNSSGRNGGRSPFLQGRQHIFHSQSQFLFSTQTFFVQLHKLIIVGFSRTFVPFQKRRNTLARFGCGIFSLSRDIQKKKVQKRTASKQNIRFIFPLFVIYFVSAADFQLLNYSILPFARTKLYFFPTFATTYVF